MLNLTQLWFNYKPSQLFNWRRTVESFVHTNSIRLRGRTKPLPKTNYQTNNDEDCYNTSTCTVIIRTIVTWNTGNIDVIVLHPVGGSARHNLVLHVNCKLDNDLFTHVLSFNIVVDVWVIPRKRLIVSKCEAMLLICEKHGFFKYLHLSRKRQKSIDWSGIGALSVVI